MIQVKNRHTRIPGVEIFHVQSLALSVQEQVHGVIHTMKDNISKVLERGDKLEDLQERSGVLTIYKQMYTPELAMVPLGKKCIK